MWRKPWGLGEGTLTCIGLIAIGFVLQICTGGINWDNLSSPINVYLLIAYIIILCLLFSLRQRIYFIRWAMCYKAAIPSITFVAAITLIMGLVRQVPANSAPADAIGFSKMLSFWPFVLLYWWATTILGLTTLKQFSSFHWRKLPVICSHLGLFTAILCGTLGSADMQRLTMNTRVGGTEWRASDTNGNLHELPLAIELRDFTIDEYPPKLMIIDNATGKSLPDGNPEHILLDESTTAGTIAGWNIKVSENLDMAASVTTEDTIKFVEWHSLGATSAVCIEATSSDGKTVRNGWVSCGSFAFPYNAMRLDNNCSIVMPDREPKRFASKVKIYTQTGKILETEIEVNKPAKIDGWKIYQLSYDETKGRWSDISVFELVSDPWLPFVYSGIGLMLVGAIAMFLTAHRNHKKVEENV